MEATERARLEVVERSPLAQWLRRRIDDQVTIAAERTGQPYLTAMHAWDVQNVKDLRETWLEHVKAYQAHPHDPGYIDGPVVPYTPEDDEAYFDRRLDWLKVTLERLRSGQ
jgi:hypothetical protein